MMVVFLEEVEGTARTGDVKNVAGGFARNYLLPRKIDLKQPIRELGSHQVNVKLTRNVLANVTVNVYPIGGVPVPEVAAPQAVEETAEAAEPGATADETGETGAAELEEEAGPAEV